MTFAEGGPPIESCVGRQVGEDVVDLPPEQETQPEVPRLLPLQHGGGGEGSLGVVAVVLVVPQVVRGLGRLYGGRRSGRGGVWSPPIPPAADAAVVGDGSVTRHARGTQAIVGIKVKPGSNEGWC